MLLKTREFRAKDFLVRSTHSFERLEMQILYSFDGGNVGYVNNLCTNSHEVKGFRDEDDNKCRKNTTFAS